MRRWTLAVLLMLIISLAAPAMAADAGRYSYITIERVDIDVVNDRATIEVTYKIDDGIQLLVLLLGKNDLKQKLETVINFNDADFQRIEMNRAILVLDDASRDYQDGSYWFPEHEFGIVIPFLSVNTPQISREYSMTKSFPDGIGHFEV